MSLVVCFLGTYEANYERNRILISGLEENGIKVLRCHVPVWEEIRYKTLGMKSPFRWLSLTYRLCLAYLRLTWSYLRLEEHDIVVVGYLGHLDAILLSQLCHLRGKKVVFDAFISLYDTLVADRKIVREGSLSARILAWIDRVSCQMVDRVLLDTEQHISYFTRTYGLDRNKFRRVFAGADTSQFHPMNGKKSDGNDGFTVFHYSKFAPMHGLDVILDAAKSLESDRTIRFLIVGGGQIEKEVEKKRNALTLRNLERVEWMEPEQLVANIETAGTCLGIFGNTDKSDRVIPNKVFQYMAVGTAIITRNSSGVRELLTDGENVLLCDPGDSQSLVDAIVRLKDNPSIRSRIAKNAKELFDRNCTPLILGKELIRILSEVLESNKSVFPKRKAP